MVDLERAVRLNRELAAADRLDWGARVDDVARLLGFTSRTPGEHELAEAVARWQSEHGLDPVDGIIGRDTWGAMRPRLGPREDDEARTTTTVDYPVSPGARYGPKWKDARPPGLPATARACSAREAAIPRVRSIAEDEALDRLFVDTLAHLAMTESGGMYARPANVFDARPPGQRPEGVPLITAWGVFQFNRDAWRHLPGTRDSAMPWDCTPDEEVRRPVGRYAQLFRAVVDAGGRPLDAARSLRLWHRSPKEYRAYLRRGSDADFLSAWSAVPAVHRDTVDAQLAKGGIAPG